jgi:hypothetical protein
MKKNNSISVSELHDAVKDLSLNSTMSERIVKTNEFLKAHRVDKSAVSASALSKKAEKKVLKEKTKKVNTENQTQTSIRNVVAFAIDTVNTKDLSRYEKRSYMNRAIDADKAELFLKSDKSCHVTVFYNSATKKYERLTTQIAYDVIKAHIQANKAKVTRYITSDFQRLLQSASSSYTDLIRSACRRLHKEKVIEMREIKDNSRTRAKYEYIVL